MYALATAACGSRTCGAGILARQPDLKEKEIGDAKAEFNQLWTVRLDSFKPPATGKQVSARFNLVFDSSPRPERAEFVDGDESLRPAGEQMRDKDFPVRFPDASSIKIVRRAVVRCKLTECTVELAGIDAAGLAGK